MRIAISALSRFGSPTGICRYAANLASYLSRSRVGSRVFLFVGAWQQAYFRKMLPPDVVVELIGIHIKNNSLARNWWYFRELAKQAADLGTDMLHCAFPAPVGRGNFRGRIITTIHDLYAYDCQENFGFPGYLFNRAFFRIALANSDGLICVSHFTLDRLRHHAPSAVAKGPVGVIPNIVEFSDVVAAMPEGIEAVSKFFLCIAQHRKNKNLDLLIEAFARLRCAGEVEADLLLIIVGTSGPETGNIKKIALQLAPSKILFMTGLNDDELAWLYQRCEVLIIPSTIEGFCLPLIEGMHFSCRIVCSDIPVLREAGSAECIYFDLARTPGSLAAAIRTALRSSVPDHSNALTKYSPQVAMEKQLRFYGGLEKELWASQEQG